MVRDEITGAGDRPQLRPLFHDLPGGLEVVDDQHAVEQARDGRPHLAGDGHQVRRPLGAGHRDGAGRGRRARGGDDQVRPAALPSPQELHRVHRALQGLHRDRLGGGAQHRGEGRLGAGSYGHHGRDRAEHPGDRPAVGGQQRRTAVRAPGQAQLQRLEPRLQRGDLALRLLVGRARGRQRGPGRAQRGIRAGDGALGLLHHRLGGLHGLPGRLHGRQGDLHLLGQDGVAVRLGLLLGGELRLGAPGPLLGLGQGPGQPPDLLLGGLRAAAHRADLAPEPGEPLTAVGGGPGLGGQPPLLGRERVLGLGAPGHGVGERLPLPGQQLLQHPFLLADLLGLALVVLGIAPAPLHRGVGGVPVPLGGQPGQAAQPLAERGQPEVGLLRGGQPRLGLGLGRLQLRLALLALLQLLLHRPAAGQDGGLVGGLTLQGGPQREHVVGEQAQPGVAEVGLDDGGPAGDLGLPAQRLELTAQLGDEVLDTVQVGLHGVQLPQRLLLALAVLQDAGGLLDERPAVLRAGVQHLVELALADDDVHLAADAGVRQQLLDVEQAAGVAVDGVLALAAPEHQAADRDLGVVDREGPVGVVDGERDLGAAQRGTRGGAGEDDVLHLAAAQGLGAVLAHDPGQGVDDVGLAGAVGADDGGDARLEAQGGRRGEGLETAQGEGLQVHRNPLIP